MKIGQTPSQTVGPFFAFGLHERQDMAGEAALGQRIRILGNVYDGDGAPIVDALVELWQADAQGIYNHPEDPRQAEADPNFHGFGRSGTVHGGFVFKTIKPGTVPAPAGGQQAPHIFVRVFSRGMLIHANSRLYFSDEPANARDAVLATVPAERRHTLIAQLQSGQDLPTYKFDIFLQGEDETVFFEP
ncbi:MAG: protocatechuate 3,4-dioxygenase subunit alpha [Anaerolineales bacterium]|nr:protocatechuate 3,4-dioxygenase subunit alpha [Anaerolineales bacterium]